MLGGGVSGLTTALQLLRAGHRSVQIWQEMQGQTPPNWVWEYPPYHVEPEAEASAWARDSLRAFTQLAAEEPESHIFMIPVVVLSQAHNPMLRHK